MRTIGLEPITVLDVILSHKRIPFRQVRMGIRKVCCLAA